MIRPSSPLTMLLSRHTRRRDFITLLGCAGVWPVAARAQQPALPIIGFVHGGAARAFPGRIAAFRVGLSEAGYIEGQNVLIEYHWLEGHFERLPALMTDLVQRRVAVIATPGSTPASLVAKAATAAIPIVFRVSEDPGRAEHSVKPFAARWQRDGHQFLCDGDRRQEVRADARTSSQGD